MQSLFSFYEAYVLHPTTLSLLGLAVGFWAVLLFLSHPRTDGPEAGKRLELAEWMGLSGSMMTERYRPMGRAVLVLAGVLCVVLFVLGLFALAGLAMALWDVIDPTNPHALAGRGVDAAGDGLAGQAAGATGQPGFAPGDNIRGIAFALAAIFGLPFLVWRTLVAQKQSNVSEQSHITERISKAVEQLGAEKEVSFIGRPVTVWTGAAVRRFLDFGSDEEVVLPKNSLELARKIRTDRTWDERADDVVEETVQEVGFRQWPAEETFIERQNEPVPWGQTDHVVKKGDWVGFKQTEPNIEVRIGAIYALERIAQDSLRDHVQIMEILTAYVRENSPASSAQDHGLGDWEPLAEDASNAEWAAHLKKRKERFGRIFLQSKAWNWARTLSNRTDIQAAVSVIGRRDTDQIAAEIADTRHHAQGYRLDLRQTNLQGVDLKGLHFARAMVSDSRLEGANLSAARLEGANLRAARLEGANLNAARLEWANLRAARLEGAYLHAARLEGAYLRAARLEGANLREARLEGANLYAARLDASTVLTASFCQHLAVKSVNFSLSADLTQNQVDRMFGDGSTVLPDGLAQPEHWPEGDLDWGDFNDQWQAWREASGG